jgi:hypothetical protein
MEDLKPLKHSQRRLVCMKIDKIQLQPNLFSYLMCSEKHYQASVTILMMLISSSCVVRWNQFSNTNKNNIGESCARAWNCFWRFRLKRDHHPLLCRRGCKIQSYRGLISSTFVHKFFAHVRPNAFFGKQLSANGRYILANFDLILALLLC